MVGNTREISVTKDEDYKYISSTFKVMACIKSYMKTQKKEAQN